MQIMLGGVVNSFRGFSWISSLFSFNPAFLMYCAVFFVSLFRGVFPRSKKWQQALKMFMFFACVLILFFKIFLVEPFQHSYFILRSDWFRSILFGDLDSHSLVLGISILCILCFLLFDYIKTSFFICMRSLLYVISAIGAIFSNDMMSLFFYFELMSIVSISIVLSDKSLEFKKSMYYAVMHFLSGTLFLLSLLFLMQFNYVNGTNSVFLRFVGVIMSVSIFIVLGVPPFNFLFTDVYGNLDDKNFLLPPVMLSKIMLYSFLSCGAYLSRDMMFVGGFVSIFVCFVRILREKSLLKTLILLICCHNAFVLILFTFDCNPILLNIFHYLGFDTMTMFFIMSVVKILTKALPSLKHDILLLHEVRKANNFYVHALVALMSLVVGSFPIVASSFSKMHILTKINVAYVDFALFLNKIISIFVGLKIVFSYFGFWNKFVNVKNKSNFENVTIELSFKMLLLFGVVIALFLLGFILDYVGFGSIYDFSGRLYSFSVLFHYIILVFAVACVCFLLKKYLIPSVNTESVMPNFIGWVDNLFVYVYDISRAVYFVFKSGSKKVFDSFVKFVILTLRKSAIGVFSSLYSSEMALCILVLLYFCFYLCFF